MIRAGVFLACAATLALTGAAKPTEAQVVERAVAAATSAIGSATSLAGRSLHRIGGKAMRHRRLAEASAQCAWKGSCDADEAFLAGLVPATGALREMYDVDQLCRQRMTQQACVEVDEQACSWDVTDGSCSAGQGPINRFVASIMGNPSDCGPYAAFLKCSMFEAKDPGCSAANKCVVADGSYELEGGVCKATQSCQARDAMEAFCPSFDSESMGPKLEKCIEDSGSTMLEAALMGVQAMMAKYSDCVFADCPTLAKIMKVTLQCSPYEDQASCSAEASCRWDAGEDGGCSVQGMEMVLALLPESCAWRGVFEASGACSGKAQDACSGGCDWSESLWCDESAAVQSEFECSAQMSTIMEGILTTNNAEGVIFYNVFQVGENCQKMTNESSCNTASVELRTVAADASGASRAMGAVLSLLGAALGTAMLTF